MNKEQSIPFVLALDDASARLSQVGGKGASLARMAASGLPVPPGFHITTAAYHRFVIENGLQEQILAAVSAITPDQPATRRRALGLGIEAHERVVPRHITAAIGAKNGERWPTTWMATSQESPVARAA